MTKKVVGLIPIKLNNERLPGKNTKLLGDKALCQYLFDTVTKVGNLDEVYVYCSDDSICQYIPDGIRFLKRPAELNGSTIKSRQILECFVAQIDADVYALMHVTEPFIKPETIRTSIAQVLSGEFDSAFVAHTIKEFAWYRDNPLNYALTDVVKTQELEPVYVEGELYVFEKNVLTEMGRRIGDRAYICPISWQESICIDDMDDFLMAQAVIELQKNN